MYPDDDDVAHPIKCWRFYDPTNYVRGLSVSDIATVAGMTRATMRLRRIDPQRVYEIGMSSGALLTSDLAGEYPDLFAAIGIMAGGPYGVDSCISGVVPAVPSVGFPAAAAAAAFGAEGRRARVIPFIVLNGDADNVVAPGCDDQAVQQWLRTDNLVLGGSQTAPLKLTPQATPTYQVPRGRTYKLSTYTEPSGCLIGEHYVIHGMGHFWSGGTANPAYSSFTDPTGPSAAAASWSFFERYRKSQTAGGCATTGAG
jgi:poly(3-hydroxybutyrate) depolymerase